MTAPTRQVDSEAAALMLGVTVNHFRVLVCRTRGEVQGKGKDLKGRTLYDLADVERLQKRRQLATAA